MKKLFALWLGLSATVFSFSASTACAADHPIKLGVVNVQLLLKEAPQALAATKNLEKQFAPQQAELRKSAKKLQAKQVAYKKNKMVLNASQRAEKEQEISMMVRQLQRKQSDLQESVNIRRNSALARLQVLVNQAIKQIGKSKGFDLILYDGIAYTNGRVDVTQDVLSALKKTYSTKRSAFNK